MTRRVLPLLASAMLAACHPAASSDLPTPTVPPTPSSSPSQVMLPALSGSMPKLYSGMVTLTGDSGAGTATFTGAPYAVDEISTFGGGAFSVQLAATSYASASAQSLFGVFPDDDGTEYVVLGLLSDDPVTQRMQVVYGVFLKADFAAGADIAFDGVSRYAIFAAGDEAAENPDTIAIATTGTLHLAATATLAGPIDASLSGTFVAGEIVSDSPDGGTTNPPPTDPPAPSAGAYTLTVDPATYAQCEGTLVGHEADYQAFTPAQLGLQLSTAVTVSVSGGKVLIDGGGQLVAAFGRDPLALDAVDGAWQGQGDAPGTPGPDGTTLTNSVLFLETTRTPYAGSIGYAWVQPDFANACLASWSFTLAP